MSQYPVISGGLKMSARVYRSMLPVFVYKLASEDRPSTTTLADDTDLTLPLEANAAYHVRMFVHYAAISAAGFQTAWTVPSGATGARWALGAGPTQVASTDVPGRFGVHGFTTACEYGDRASASNQMGAFEEAIVQTTNAGTIALQWAQVASNATAARVASGSFVCVQRLL